jgi:hypothetical protein
MADVHGTCEPRFDAVRTTTGAAGPNPTRRLVDDRVDDRPTVEEHRDGRAAVGARVDVVGEHRAGIIFATVMGLAA